MSPWGHCPRGARRPHCKGTPVAFIKSIDRRVVAMHLKVFACVCVVIFRLINFRAAEIRAAAHGPCDSFLPAARTTLQQGNSILPAAQTTRTTRH